MIEWPNVLLSCSALLRRLNAGSTARWIAVLCVFGILPGCAVQQEEVVDLYVDAVMLRDVNENEAAVEKLNQAIAVDKRFSLAHSMLGDIQMENRQYPQSAESYEVATKLNPWSFKDHFNLGRVYQIMDHYEKAIDAYLHASTLDPNHVDAHFNAAQCYYQIEDYNNALVKADRAESLDDTRFDIKELLGDIHESLKDYEQAIRSYKRALEIDSNNMEVMTSLAVAYLKTNRTEPALELLQTIIQNEPQSSDAYQYLGYAYLRFYEQYVSQYKQMINTTPDQTEKLDAQREKVFDMLEQSIASYLKAIETNSRDWQAHRGLGVAYAIKSTNENDQTLRQMAVDQWQMALEIKPDQTSRQALKKLIRKYSQ